MAKANKPHINRQREERDLHRLTVDEAIPELDEFIHSAFQSDLYRVWVVHGIGSGILRREVRRYLSKHPQVRTFRTGDGEHGGVGATQIELSDF